ncbi:MAG: ABC transporter permease [Candidatus Odinarchaeota archaeon]|nr:ABC transporter permease [Candidatus Odinarchaeota archaeon]
MKRKNFRFSILIKETKATLAIAKNIWKLDLAYPMSALYFIFAPFLWYSPFLLFAYFMAGGRNSETFGAITGYSDVITYLALGASFALLVFTSMWSTAFGLRREQWMGTLEAVYSAPVSRFSIVLGHSLHSVSHIGLGVLMQIIMLHLLIGLQLNYWGLIPSLLAVGLAVISLQAIGLILSSIVITAKQGWMVAEFVGDVLYIFTPVAYPITILPEYIRFLAYYNPTYYGTEAFRGFLLFGLEFSKGWWLLFVLTIINLVALAVGYFIFQKTDHYIRNKGSLNKF